MSKALTEFGRNRWLKVCVAILVVLAAGVVGAVIANASRSNTTPAISASTGSPSSCDVTAIAERDLASVVTIFAGSGSSSGVGSGEIIRSGGYILTNNHVISPAVGSSALAVVFSNGTRVPATIVGRDPLTDLAVIRVSDQSGLRPISIGDSETVRIGQGVVALGAPLGLSSTVTSGIVSSLGRAVNVPGEGAQSALLIDAIQTDAAINPGNSGGALVACNGDLVGIPTAGASIPSSSGEATGGSIGLGFAIPVNFAMKIGSELIAKGSVTHAFIGIQAQPVAASATGETSQPQGLGVIAVTAGGPAARAGLQAGDIITSIDGAAAESTDQLMAVTLTKRPGQQVKFEYSRGGHTASTTITLTARP